MKTFKLERYPLFQATNCGDDGRIVREERKIVGSVEWINSLRSLRSWCSWLSILTNHDQVLEKKPKRSSICYLISFLIIQALVIGSKIFPMMPRRCFLLVEYLSYHSFNTGIVLS